MLAESSVVPLVAQSGNITVLGSLDVSKYHIYIQGGQLWEIACTEIEQRWSQIHQQFELLAIKYHVCGVAFDLKNTVSTESQSQKKYSKRIRNDIQFDALTPDIGWQFPLKSWGAWTRGQNPARKLKFNRSKSVHSWENQFNYVNVRL